MDQQPSLIWGYLDWLIPIATGCFFPKTKDTKRSFKWPGFISIIKCLFLELFYIVCALVFMVAMTVYQGLVLITGMANDSITVPGLPLSSDKTKGRRFPVTRLDASQGEATPAIIQGFVSRSEPVIIKNIAKDTFAALSPGGYYNPPMTKEEMDRGTLHMNVFPMPRNLGKLGEWISKHMQKPVLYMARFAGTYKSGYAHIDSCGTYNVYYVARGRKNVWICPRQYNHLVNFQRGYNAAFIPGSDGVSRGAFWWINTVPGVWEFELEAGDVLLFNNTACIHKFVNATKDPEIFTTRCANMDFSPRIAKNDAFNWYQARFFVGLMLSATKTVEHPAGKAGIIKTVGKFEDKGDAGARCSL